jgi:hypothetical protein
MVGRGNAWDQQDPASKRRKLSPPPAARLTGGIAGRARATEHADNLGGHGNAPFGSMGDRQNASSYDDNVPAGSAEPMD